VLRDANENITINRLSQGLQTITASGGVTTLTAASDFNQLLTGTGNHAFRLPDATTLTDTTAFQFNNAATGTLTIQNNAGTTVGTVTTGGAANAVLVSNATVGGTWEIHGYLPEGVTWGTNALALGSTVISGGTWQGGTIASGYGGTGLTTFAGANNALYSTSASALVAGTLPVAAGGTGQSTYTDGELLIGNGIGNTLTKTTLTAGTGISVSNGSGSITISSTASVCCACSYTAGIVYGKTQCGAGSGIPPTAAVALGFGAGGGSNGTGSVAIGQYAAYCSQGNKAVAVGPWAGSTGQGSCAIAIGSFAGGASQPASSIAIGPSTTASGANQTHIGPIRNVCSTSGLQGLFYCATSREVIRGTAGGGTVAIANGGTGQTTQQAAINALVGTQTANRVLRSNGTNMSLSQVALATDVSGTLAVANGGTGQTTYTNGQLLIGNTTGNTLAKATLTAGSNITITNGPGTITIAASGGGASCATLTTAGVVFGQTSTTPGAITALGRSISIAAGVSSATAVGYGITICSNSSVVTAIGVNSAVICCAEQAVAIMGTVSGGACGGCGGVAVGNIAATSGGGGIAIGNAAFSTNNGISIGKNANGFGGDNIILNATGSAIFVCCVGTFHVMPIRNATGPYTLKYDPATGEITYI
jgi:hypothetical protein